MGWKELNGYHGKDDVVPEYRKVYAAICVDAVVGSTKITGQQMGSHSLPDFARDAGIDEHLTLAQGLGELEDLTRGDRSSVHFSLPMSTIIAGEMDRESGQPFQQTHAIYWNLSISTIRGVVEKVRTALAEFLAELLDQMPSQDARPTKDAVDSALTFVLSGQSIVNINSGANSSSEATNSEETQVGDKFENITNSTIVNRSLVNNAFNALASRGDEEAASALRELERLVVESGNSEAGECLDGLTEELTKSEPRKSVIKAMWSGIITALPYVANVAAISTGIGHLTA